MLVLILHIPTCLGKTLTYLQNTCPVSVHPHMCGENLICGCELTIEADQAQAFFSYLRLAGKRVTALPFKKGTLPDPIDIPFAEVDKTGNVEALVTGNRRHFLGNEDVEKFVRPPQETLKLV